MTKPLKIISIDLLEQNKSCFHKSIKRSFENLHDSELSIDGFNFILQLLLFSHLKLKVRKLNWILL
jgi:hypothetical protein